MKQIDRVADLRAGKIYLEYDVMEHSKTIYIVRCCEIRNKLFHKMWAEGERIHTIVSSLEPTLNSTFQMTLRIYDMPSLTFNLEPFNYYTFELTEDEIYNIIALTI